MLLSDELRAAGFTVIEAASGDEAAAILHAGVHIDILITDLQMPGMLDGHALARLVRSTFPSIKIVLASANAGEHHETLIDGSFNKPYDLPALCRRLQELISEDTHRRE
jgi:CheY-like chemotaxis protein